MKIRDGHATLNGDKTVHDMPSDTVDIIADDGRTLFDVTLNKDGTIRVSAGSTCKHLGVILNDSLRINPMATNCIILSRPEYK